MARTVRDAAILLGALTGVDPRDRGDARERRPLAHRLHARRSTRTGLRGARIGVARKRYTGYSAETDKLFDAALDLMKQHGATIVDPADIATAGKTDDSEFELLLYEFKADLNAYLAQRRAERRRAVARRRDRVQHEERRRASCAYFGQEIMEQAQKKGPLTEKKYLDELAKNRRLMGARGHRRDDRRSTSSTRSSRRRRGRRG